MRLRLLLCLLLCLSVAPTSLPRIPSSPPLEPTENPVFLSVTDDGSPLPDDATMRELAQRTPIVFLENCLRRYGREVRGYTGLLHKHERIDKQLVPREVLEIAFRDQPHSVWLKWVKGARRAGTVLYVKGENDNQVLIKPAGLLSVVGVVARHPYSDDARQNGRYWLPEFGIRYGTERVLASWVAASKRNALHVQYLGIRPIAELDNRTCFVLRRTGYEWPEVDGITDLVLYVDVQNWLQTGTVLRGEKGELIAEYFFRDLRINPYFAPEQFSKDGLK